jgi:hypothetical protein
MIRASRSCKIMLAIIALGCAGVASAQTPVAFDLPAPKLVGDKADWLNTDGKALTFEKGRVYVVEFWTFG